MYRIIVPVVFGLIAAVTPLRAQGLFVTTTDFATGSTAFLAHGAATAEVNLLGIQAGDNVHCTPMPKKLTGRFYHAGSGRILSTFC